MILIRVRRPGKEEHLIQAPDDRLQDVLDRAWREFGDPAKCIGGPNPAEESK